MENHLETFITYMINSIDKDEEYNSLYNDVQMNLLLLRADIDLFSRVFKGVKDKDGYSLKIYEKDSIRFLSKLTTSGNNFSSPIEQEIFEKLKKCDITLDDFGFFGKPKSVRVAVTDFSSINDAQTKMFDIINQLAKELPKKEKDLVRIELFLPRLEVDSEKKLGIKSTLIQIVNERLLDLEKQESKSQIDLDQKYF